MDGDDLSGLLPKPPPPRPARRAAAIAAAMRRFDGVADPPAEAGPPRTRASWGTGRWGQIGAFASILLVAVVGIPLALKIPSTLDPAPPPDMAAVERQANRAQPPIGPSPAARNAGSPAGKPAVSPALAAPATAANVAEAPVVSVPAANKAAPAEDMVRRETLASRVAQPPSLYLAPPPAAPPPVAEARAAAPSPGASIAVTGSRLARSAPAPAPPAAMADATEADEVMVTGARLSRAVSRRGDWNACTVNDPERSVRGCKRLVNPAAKGAAGVAAAQLSDGLALAWEGEWERAIGAFDQAIALQPKSAFAYLNRGLAHRRNGEPARAAADLDLAIRHAPYAARGYYSRSLLRRERGDARGAAVDAERAIELDPRYAAVLD
jgi:hypothetical protein